MLQSLQSLQQKLKTMAEKKQISIAGVLADLEAGLERDQIKEKYELSHSEMRYLFSHEKLKHKKTKKAINLELVDDVPQTPKRQSSDGTGSRKGRKQAIQAESAQQVAATSVASQNDTNLVITDDTEQTITTAQAESAPAAQAQEAAPATSTIKEVPTEDDKEDAAPSTGVGLW